MEADWEIELGGDAPVIDACWPGFVDLRQFPNRIAELPELSQLPALSATLLRLNDVHSSPVWTSKCDVWPVADFDSIELDATPEAARYAVACYIDLLPRSDQQWTLPEMAVAACETFCARLHSVPLTRCRADFIVRRAFITPDLQDLGITAYLTACGAGERAAFAQLAAALAAFADSVFPTHAVPLAASKLQ